MEKETAQPQFNVFSAMIGIAFIIGLIVYEFGMYSYFSRDGSPWLMMFIMNAIYIVVAFVIISALSGFGRFGMILGYIISIAGLFLLGVSTYTL
ncbi:hypothetical protein AB1K09_20050 [Solibacillus silvestris]